MKSTGDLLNDNESLKKLFSNNDSVNVKKKLDISEDQIDKIADWLEHSLCPGDDSSRGFHCKVARYFPRGYLTGVVAKAQRGRNPSKLFSYLMNREMKKRGIE